MDQITVNTSRLGNDAQTINSCINNMKKAMSDMKKNVSAIEKMWEGEAKQSFHGAWQNDMNELQSVIKNLSGIYKYETGAKVKYEKCERKVSDVISGIRI